MKSMSSIVRGIARFALFALLLAVIYRVVWWVPSPVVNQKAAAEWLETMKDEDGVVRGVAYETLKKIDPEAAAKARAK